MDFHALAMGLIVGALIAIPLGPTGVFCLRNALVHGALCGFISGLGAAFADALYSAAAGVGVSAATPFLERYSAYLKIFGAIALCILGVLTFRSKPKSGGPPLRATHTTVFMTTFILTITNPMTVIGLAAIYAALGLAHNDITTLQVLSSALGVFLGSAAAWLAMSMTAAFYSDKMTDRSSVLINRLSGIVIFVFGLVTFVV